MLQAMPDSTPALTLSLHPSIAEIPAADWDACAGDDNPFVSHAFLAALEASGSASSRTGWLPQHAALRDAADPLALNPAYDSGDHLHPNDAGHAAMAAAVDLRELRE